jgi:GT2 family glycosyltransferase
VRKRISVIIPTFNSRKTLIACIESILNQTFKPQEVIVVDNASTDGTSEKVIELMKSRNSIKLVKNDKNIGVTGGRNKGIREVSKKYDYLLFFDHDMVADMKMLEKLLEVVEGDSRIGIATPKIYFWEKKDVIWSAGTGIDLNTGKTWFRNGVDTGQYNEVQEVQVAPAALLVKRQVIDKIKGFDDTFYAVFEDTDFCFRAREFGFLTYYVPEAIAYHRIPYDKKESMKRLLTRLFWVGRNRTIFLKKHSKNLFVYLINLPIFIIYYLYLSLKFGNFRAFTSYIKGTISGLCYQIS